MSTPVAPERLKEALLPLAEGSAARTRAKTSSGGAGPVKPPQSKEPQSATKPQKTTGTTPGKEPIIPTPIKASPATIAIVQTSTSVTTASGSSITSITTIAETPQVPAPTSAAIIGDTPTTAIEVTGSPTASEQGEESVSSEPGALVLVEVVETSAAASTETPAAATSAAAIVPAGHMEPVGIAAVASTAVSLAEAHSAPAVLESEAAPAPK